jgi:hypothetical protein
MRYLTNGLLDGFKFVKPLATNWRPADFVCAKKDVRGHFGHAYNKNARF